MTQTDENIIPAEFRSEFGKGAARRVRRANKVPAVLYGRGTDPQHLSLPGHATMMALKVTNALLNLDIEGASQLALVKDVQRDPLTRNIDHVDLVVVRRGEKVIVEIPIQIEGEAASETIVALDSPTLSVEAEATNIPDFIVVSVEDLEAGTQILAEQVELPEGSSLVTEPDVLVVNVTQAMSQEALDAELADAEAVAGIEQDAPEETEEAAEGSED